MSEINKINRVVISKDVLKELDSKVSQNELSNTQTEIENKIDEINNSLGRINRPPVSTFDDISTTYPTPSQGWLVKTLDTGLSYEYDEEKGWYLVTLNPIPEATETTGGLLTKEDKAKLNSIEDGAEKNKTPLEVLDDLKMVDGHSSGLDADTLDGRHGDEFAPTVHNHDGLYYKKNEVDVKVNSKANTTALTSHINDSEKHLTLEDRSVWNSGIIKIGTTPPESSFLFWLDTSSND